MIIYKMFIIILSLTKFLTISMLLRVARIHSKIFFSLLFHLFVRFVLMHRVTIKYYHLLRPIYVTFVCFWVNILKAFLLIDILLELKIINNSCSLAKQMDVILRQIYVSQICSISYNYVFNYCYSSFVSVYITIIRCWKYC